MKIKIKKIFISLICVLIVNIKLFATGAGAQAAIIPGSEGIKADLKGTVRLMNIPLVFGFGIEAGTENNILNFGFSGFSDYWIIDKQLHNTINFYAGPGISAHIYINEGKSWQCLLGARGIVGINFLLYDNYLEFYLQGGIEPSAFIPITEKTQLKYRTNFPCETGFRVHF